MVTEKVKEKVIVGAVFGHGQTIRPAWFIWSGRKIRVAATTFSWTERVGTDLVHHFAVTDGSDSFELALDAARMIWELRGVDVTG